MTARRAAEVRGRACGLSIDALATRGAGGIDALAARGSRGEGARASVLVLALAAAALALALAAGLRSFWMPALGGGAGPEPFAEHQHPAGSGAADPLAPPDPNAGDRGQGAMQIGALQIGREAPDPRPEVRPFDESRLEGRGRLRGSVTTTAGIEFPQEWRLSVQPSKVLIGGERAESRTLEFERGEQEFELEDLPLGGYEVQATSFGLASATAQLLLARPAEDDVYLNLVLVPTGYLDGRAVDARGRPVAELPVALLSRAEGARRSAQTDAGGYFLIADLRDGLYELIVGSPQAPLLPPREIAFRAPAEHLADLVLPELGELRITVVDDTQHAVSGAVVRGYGDHGGSIETSTDARGEARARFLPAGRYTLFATDESGRAGRTRHLLESGESAAVIVRLER